jgi:hypothetical protein
MSPISGIALSGMSAAQTRLAAAANNIANAGTAGYQRLRVETLPGPGGVSTVVSREPEAAPGLYVEDAVEQAADAGGETGLHRQRPGAAHRRPHDRQPARRAGLNRRRGAPCPHRGALPMLQR